MVTKLFKVFGDSNEKQIKRLEWVAEAVNHRDTEFRALSDDALRGKTSEFRERIENGVELNDLIPDSFAAVREAAWRTVGMRHFDVQLIGGLVLQSGGVAEMKTGEGKTLVATLPMYLNALSSDGAHLVTVNDYLARRDAHWMGAIYHALGLTVGCLQHETAFLYEPGTVAAGPDLDGLRAVPRRDAYAADITYGTNNEFGFDYLRDNMSARKDQQVQRPLHYAIVDEVDNILVDEARTPLIISGPAQESSQQYQQFARIVPRLKEGTDFKIEAKERQAVLTEEGIEKLEGLLNVDNLYDPVNFTMTHFVENALRAQFIYDRDREYVVQNREVIIVDEFTGRLMPGRRYADGLHQAIEAKERVEIQSETITYATITLQNYFRMYPKLAGMTGTAVTEAEEFHKVYNLDVLGVPTNKPLVREDLPDLLYKSERRKFIAVADEIAQLHEQNRPVLVGTVSIERSEELSGLLMHRGVPHEVLNAKNHEREAQIVAQAGRPGAVTVSTSMAGRGTDIILGGDPSATDSPETWQASHDQVVALGGLYVIGTERHDSRRIDNQLRGRAGRQGDPGTTRFFGSLEDDIIKRFGGSTVGRIVGATLPDDVPLESGLLTKTMEMTQSKVEAHYFDMRKHLVEYDDVVNTQRGVMYDERQKVLDEADMKNFIQQVVGAELAALVRGYMVGDPNDWDVDVLLAEISTILPHPEWLDEDFIVARSVDEVEDALLGAAENFYDLRENAFGEDLMRELERAVLLQTTDKLWVQHLTQMSNLREGIGLHAYGQRDPLMMYKKEGHEQFDSLRERIRHDIAHSIFHVAPVGHADVLRVAGEAKTNRRPKPTTSIGTAKRETVVSQMVGNANAMPTKTRKMGRNDPCWCGSGKKFKRCHGLTA